jgi:hypothetical protein
MSFNISAVEKMRLDSSGNLGLGVTPSAWATLGAGVQLKGSGYLMGRADGVTQVSLGLNSYYDGTDYRYVSSGNAVAQYQQYLGAHTWKIAPSGTAGNAITFTEAMRIHASGGVSIGNTTDAGANCLIVTGVLTVSDTLTNLSGLKRVVLTATNSGGSGIFATQYGSSIAQTGWLYIQETGTSNFATYAAYKQNSSTGVTLTLIQNSGLTVNATNSGGTCNVIGASNTSNVKMRSVIYNVVNGL